MPTTAGAGSRSAKSGAPTSKRSSITWDRGRRQSNSIERIRNHEGYKPGNVRWATLVEKNNNKRTNVTAVIDGETLTAAQIAARYGLSHRIVSYRIQVGKTGSEITAKPRRAK